MKAMKELLLVDAMAYLFRAFHAVRDLTTSTGKPTGAIFGTLNMLDKLRRDHPQAAIACVMDAPGKTFRHALFKQYKATRPPAPPELKAQIAALPQFIRAYGLPLISVSNVEADDVIASYAVLAGKEGISVTVASSDKDLMQLVTDDNARRVQLYDGMKDKWYDENAVREKYGVAPAQMGDYLALVGDSSDNIPGVAKVGAKTAAKWLAQHGTLAALQDAADSIKGVVGDNLRAAIADNTLTLSRQLVTLKDDVEPPQPLAALATQTPDITEWKRLCAEYEFKNLTAALDDGSATASTQPAAPTIEIITDAQTLDEWIKNIRTAGIVAVDTETTGEPAIAAKLVGVSLSITGDDAAYLPLAHSDSLLTPPPDSSQPAPKQMPAADALARLKTVLEDERIVKIMHNGKYDWHVFTTAGIHLAGIIEDTKIAAYVQNAASDSTLSQLAQQHLGVTMSEYKDVVGDLPDFAAVPIHAAADYAGEDAWVTRKLHDELKRQRTPAATRVYEELDRPLMPVLAAIERAGMKIDGGALNAFAAAMREQMTTLEARAHEQAGEPFNLNAPRQLEEILFDKMGAQPLKKTGGGARSTDERTLEKLAADHPIAATVLEYRTLAKLVGTYADKLPQQILPATGRIHTSFNQTAVMTGRLSSSSPNLQNIPIKTEAGRRIRRAFIAEDGKTLLSADYSQIELRLIAHIAGDDAMLAAFAAGADIHRQTASEVFGVQLDDVTTDQRRAAKAINFGLIYGMSSFGLARGIAVGQAQAQTYIDRYFGRYPQIAAYMAQTREQGPKQGYVETIYGRRIPLTVLRGGKPAAERVAINAPIQGSAADLMKKAMLAVDAHFRAENLPAKIILQVHDELVIEADTAAAAEITARLPALMAAVADLSVALEVDIGAGQTWDEAH